MTERAALCAGVVLDLAMGDPQGWPHPVRAFGWTATRLESLLRRTALPLDASGAVYTGLLVAGAAALVASTPRWTAPYWIWSLLAIRSLDVESARVMEFLEQGDIHGARHALSRIVGRDTDGLNEEEIIRAVVETIAENLSDAVVAPLFYFAIAGPAGMAAYKAANTLDSMVGYKNERYREFGWASARLDDVLNLIPARITALLVAGAAALQGLDGKRALATAWRDGASQPSPNSGYPEAAVAGALGVQLGGTNYYGGVASCKAPLGDALAPLDRAAYRKTRALLYGTSVLAVFAAVLTMRR